jgi:hypothetical protein
VIHNSSEKITAVLHCSGEGIWIIAHDHYSDGTPSTKFYAFLLTSTGFSDTVISDAGADHHYPGTDP